MKHYLGIDLGGTKTEIALVEDNPANIIFRKKVPTQQKNGYEFIINQIADLYNQAIQSVNKKLPLGIAIPGSISPVDDKVRNANLQALNDQKLQQDLQKKLDTTVSIANDANCFTLSEHRFGAAQGMENVVGLIMGTGFGAGIIIDNNLIEGSNLLAGELGHLSIDINGPQCWCNNRGCIELYLSGSGLQRLYLEETAKHKNAQQIIALYEQQDIQAMVVVKRFMAYFARAIANIYISLDPTAIVIGGGLSNWSLLYDQGPRQIQQILIDPDMNIKIIKNKLGDSSGVFGAALLNDSKNNV